MMGDFQMRCLGHGVAAGVLSAAAIVGSTLPSPARAARSYDNCTGFIDALPATVSTQGTWCLRRDLTTALASGNAITIATNNVTVDCNDFKLGGLAAGAGTATTGISANSRQNTVVRNCNIRGFQVGIGFLGGGGHRVEHNSLDGITHTGISVESAGSTIHDNRVIDTGGSTVNPGEAIGIYAADTVDILGNTVNGVAGLPDSGVAHAYGIATFQNSEGSVAGNRVRGLVSAGAGTTFGIYNSSSGRLILRDNDVQGSGVAASVGVHCTDDQATARDNVVTGFITGISNCLSARNTVNVN